MTGDTWRSDASPPSSSEARLLSRHASPRGVQQAAERLGDLGRVLHLYEDGYQGRRSGAALERQNRPIPCELGLLFTCQAAKKQLRAERVRPPELGTRKAPVAIGIETLVNQAAFIVGL